MSQQSFISSNSITTVETHQLRAALLNLLRKSGIPYLQDIPWGTHLCGFYQTDHDLLEIVVPYLRAGLENNEYCMWIVSGSITPSTAISVLKRLVPNFDLYQPQLEILTHDQWYLKYGDLQVGKIEAGWQKKTEQALAKGYDGLRLCANTAWLTKKYWKKFLDYEENVGKKIGKLKMIALCPYQLSACSMPQILDIVNSHHFSFIKSDYDDDCTNNIAKYERINLVASMAASIAHEIRNPMTAVKGFIQLLQSKDEFTAYHDILALMVDEIERANGIISEYLSLARDKDKDIQRQDLNKILLAILPLLQADALREDKDVTLLAGEIVPLDIDTKDIRQVVLNLTRNGLEAMPKGGILKIRTYMERDQVVLAIEDSGSGIPKEVMAKLGEPFVTTKENGTGLGLPVSIKILDSYNATINIDTSAAGTTMAIFFPQENRSS
ncbi:MAG TPA: MEDS domain-containing protein [Oscillospiraceae bacterium]|nr:MEDS domain-containing protein [Oscillospiraceae bacterium]